MESKYSNSDNGSFGDSVGGVYLMSPESEDDNQGILRRKSNISSECYEKANSEKDAQGVVQVIL